jgi:hypothetical protein
MGSLDGRMAEAATLMLFPSTQRNPLLPMAAAVMVGIVTFVFALWLAGSLTRIFAHALDGLMVWVVIDMLGAIVLAFISFFVVLNRLNRP